MIPNGLTMRQVKEQLIKYGKNEIVTKNHKRLIKKICLILSEPIYLLLSIAAITYFILGEPTDGAVMIAFVFFVIGSNVLQEVRTGNTLRKLKEITTPLITVIREGNTMVVPSEELVPGDVVLIFEGVKIPADGYLIAASGLVIDESIMTGESTGVMKYPIEEAQASNHDIIYSSKHYCYTKTLVVLGNGILVVEKTGNHTEYGKIANKLPNIIAESTPLQVQLRRLATQCTIVALFLLLAVGIVTFINLSGYPIKFRWIKSILAGVVLALSMVPGEFPVIQTVFLTMGALRLTKKNALVRSLPSVETLGSISVLCLDKTGTITQNKMKVQEFWALDNKQDRLCKTLALACKEDTRDPMELAMISYGENLCSNCKIESGLKACNISSQKPTLVKEYAFTNELKAMGQVWSVDKHFMVAVKGSPETILSLCMISKEQEKLVEEKIYSMTNAGLRVIAVADRNIEKEESIPQSLSMCSLYLRGIIGLMDPPRENIIEDIASCYQAGIRVIMITGDHPATAKAIAKSVGIKSDKEVITGDELSKLDEEELKRIVKECNIFARVLPLHKLRIVKALKDNGDVVAMTGDGVNDAPAQRMANIGVAMGKYGSEVCREAAALILLDDNFSTILDSVMDGRRIYKNIRKAIGYVFAIHISIAFISFIAPLFGILPEALLLLPIHIVMLELIMDPTCSIALERQPADNDIMNQAPRKPKEALLSKSLLLKSIIQGLVIFIATFSIYYSLMAASYTPELARTAGFSVLVLSNVFLVFENCSDHEALYLTLRKLKSDKGIWLVSLSIILLLCIMIYTPFAQFFGFTKLSIPFVLMAFGMSAVSVFWYEIVKWMKRKYKVGLNSY